MALSVEDRLEIQALLAGYSHAVSNCDPDKFCALFTEDGVWERKQPASGGKYTEKVTVAGLEALREFALENFKSQGQVRYVSADLLLEGGSDEAEGEVTSFIFDLNGPKPEISVVAVFDDVYIRTPKGWKFKYRGISILN